MNILQEADKNINKLTLVKRPISISTDYRLMYKISLILLVLKLNCIKSKSSLFRIHFIMWFIKNEQNMNNFYKNIDSQNIINVTNWSIEPSIIRAVRYALAEELILRDTEKYILADKGIQFVDKIMKDDNLFQKEKSFLQALGKRTVTDEKIEELLKNIKV